MLLELFLFIRHSGKCFIDVIALRAPRNPTYTTAPFSDEKIEAQRHQAPRRGGSGT